MKKTEETAPKRGGLLNEFLWICAGVDRKILRQCPTDWAKYAGQGGLILFTALMAMLSGGYAFYFIFNSVKLAIAFGIFWGLLIFNLDRFIVNTMYSDGKYTISWGEIGAGLPRLVIAVFIGIVISTPLELKIFEDEINVTIEELKKDKLEQYTKADNAKLDQLTLKREEFRDKPIEDVIATSTGLINDGKYKELQQLKKDISAQQVKITSLRNRRALFDPYKDSVKYRTLSININREKVELGKLESRTNSIEAEIAANDVTYRNALAAAQEKKDKELAQISNEIAGLKIKIDKADSTYQSVLAEEFGGFKTRMTAYQSMKKSDKTTRWVALFITLLFIIIEVCPTIFKMMIASGPYDCLLDAERHAKKVSSLKLISDMNDAINTEIVISTKRNKNRIEAELASNKALLEQVASVQSEILATAIEKWREEEMRKVQENPGQYLQTGGNRS